MQGALIKTVTQDEEGVSRDKLEEAEQRSAVLSTARSLQDEVDRMIIMQITSCRCEHTWSEDWDLCSWRNCSAVRKSHLLCQMLSGEDQCGCDKTRSQTFHPGTPC